MNRRTFLRLSHVGATSVLLGQTPANKRERMSRWLAGTPDPNYTPAAFFLHFSAPYKNGTAAAQRHLEFFHHTDMDFVKIQFEQTYDRQDFLQKPSDWSKLTLRKIDFYEPLIVTVRELVKSTKKDAFVLMTLYSPFMCAGHCATLPLLRRHLEENPEAVKRGLEILTESQLIFVRACIKAGIDGFYTSTQGSEKEQFSSPAIFANYVKPFDLVAMKEIDGACPFNILHVCDYNAPYAGYDAVRDYPGHVVNCNPKLTGGQLSPQEIVKFFNRPFMGGMDRHGTLGDDEVRRVLANAPKQFILGADCTVAADTDWTRLRRAIDIAHRAR